MQQRSAIPKVVGVLMIVFASLGLFHTLITTLQGMMASEVVGSNMFTKAILIFALLDFGIGFLHLVAGIRALGYKDNAPRLAMLYGVLKIVSSLGFMVVMYAWIGGQGIAHGEGSVIGAVFGIMAIIYLAWPITVLALMSRPAARASCTNF